MDYMNTLEIIPRSLASIVALFSVTKLIGKKQVSELSLFDYVIGISIGNFAAEATLDFNSQFINGIVAVITFGIVAYLVSIVTMKSITLRRFFIGTPTMVIQNGKIILKNMRKSNIDINDLLEQIRTNGYFDISELEYVIMEANGKLSILPKSIYKPVTPNDMKINVDKSSLCANIIIDGKIMKNNLENMNKTTEWLEHEIKIKGTKLENILLCTLDNQDKINIYEKCKVKELNVLE